MSLQSFTQLKSLKPQRALKVSLVHSNCFLFCFSPALWGAFRKNEAPPAPRVCLLSFLRDRVSPSCLLHCSVLPLTAMPSHFSGKLAWSWLASIVFLAGCFVLYSVFLVPAFSKASQVVSSRIPGWDNSWATSPDGFGLSWFPWPLSCCYSSCFIFPSPCLLNLLSSVS